MAKARRRPSPLEDAARRHSQQLFKDWIALTFRADHFRAGPVPLPVIHVFLAVAAIAVVWKVPSLRTWALIALAVGFVFTVGRAAIIMPERRKRLLTLYEQIQKRAALPRSTANSPAAPDRHIKVRRWGAKSTIEEFTLTVGDCPASHSVFAHAPLEQAIDNTLGSPEGMSWVFDWPSPAVCHGKLVANSSPEVTRQAFVRSALSVVATTLGINARNVDDGFNVTFDGWQEVETRAGLQVMVPQTIAIDYGSFDDSNPAARSQVERTFDKRIKAPGEWMYSWDSGVLTMQQEDRQSTEAKRKRTTRKIEDNVIGMVRGNDRRADDPVVTVTKWLENSSFPVDHPQKLHIDFSTRNLAARRTRDAFESNFDDTMKAAYPSVVWLYNWTSTGAETTLDIAAVPARSKLALRKAAERRLRNVVESKFGNSRNFVDCDITSWQDNLSQKGEALPQTARVNFGDYDVTNIETQDSFEQHWNSLTTDNDWHYKWSPASGIVEMNAVPPLPQSIVFPQPGTEEFKRVNQLARTGKFILGPQMGGGDLVWDINSVPHGLVGGRTNSGKSVLLSNILFYGLYNPDMFEFFVCDPKRTDFTWTPEFPNVTRFAARPEDIVHTISLARQEMDRRQTLLGKVGVRNVGQLRELYRRQPELEKKYGPAPKRLVLFFDELAQFLSKSSDSDLEELKDEARSDLESIGLLARAMWVHVIAAAQKPSAKVISSQLLEQLEFRVCVGPVNIYTSQQIMGSDHGTRFPSGGSPKGRAWAYDSKDGYRMAQGYYLPDESGPLPWDPTIHAAGFKEIVRQRLQTLGYARTEITNSDGGVEPRWVKVEN
ncbi:hypothetical protein CHU70_10820 (plasmid) [Corynebacterium sp. LK10]|uniref:FtsK/SpoIIIE domain-containing protein n=1 Tax=Corynebacterium sp. LK10 TaxID=2022656 RepID=UPI0011C72956|nr:FtsK/SpoIIIE domain-containing protein [Corynebacterium sp. LK10]TXS81753.1 hypothetical protein CHU70_10820 [Corynebacterium sp. LK10]